VLVAMGDIANALEPASDMFTYIIIADMLRGASMLSTHVCGMLPDINTHLAACCQGLHKPGVVVFVVV